MKTSRSANDGLAASVGKNTFYGIIASLFQVATRLVTVPIIIGHIGLGGYGIWSIIATAGVYMRFGSTGIKGAFQKYVAESTGDGDYDRSSRLLSTGTAIMTAISVVILIPVVIFSKQLASAAGVPAEFLPATGRAFSILALTMLLSNSGAAFEAIVLGGHRIDVARKINSVLSVAEALAIVVFMRIGWGLVSLSCVMAAAELLYLVGCYVVAHRILPQIHIAIRYVSTDEIRELVRFAGSYQLLNVLQLTYGAVVPVVMLRAYGAEAAGVFAVAMRIAQPVVMCHNSFLLPILSGGAMVHASGESDRLRRVLAKSFKVTLAITLAPFALIGVFGPYMVEAWTGQTDPAFHYAIWLVCLASLFQAFSGLALVLYRATGGAVLDNARELMRLVALLPMLFITRQLGLEGILIWMAATEFLGVILMLIGLDRAFKVFDPKLLLPDLLRLTTATVGVVSIAAIAVHFLPDVSLTPRTQAAVKVFTVCVAAILTAFPMAYLTGAVSGTELQSVLDIFRRRQASRVQTVE